MKKIVLFSIIVLSLFSCKKEMQKEFLISKLEGLNVKSVYITFGSGRVDTIPVIDGQFKIMDAPEDPINVTLFIPENNKMYTFYGDGNSRLLFAGNVQGLSPLTITGDSANQRLSDFRARVAADVVALRKAELQAEHYWNKDSLRQYEHELYQPKLQKIKADYKEKLKQFVNLYPSTPEVVIATREYIALTNEIAILTALWPKLTGEGTKNFPAFLELKRAYKQMKLLSIGKSVTSLQAYTTEQKLDYFYPSIETKYLLLFWSSKDKYSTYLNKKYAASVEQLNKDSINYIALSLDDNAQEWSKVAKGLKGRQLLIRGGIQHETIQQFGITQTPFTVLLGKGAKVVKIYEAGESPLK